MKNLIYLFLFISLMYGVGNSQEPDSDPLAQSRIIRGNGEEVAYIGPNYDSSTGDHLEISILKYFKELEYVPQDTLVKMLSWKTPVASSWGMFYDLKVADLDNDGLNEIAAVWIEGGSQDIDLAILKPNPDLLGIDSIANWAKIERHKINDPQIINDGGSFLPNIAFVDAGNFDTDSLKEIVIAYWISPNDSTRELLRIKVYDISDSLELTYKGDVLPGGERLIDPPEIWLCEDQSYLFDIESGDFNGDGILELLITGREDGQPGSAWNIFANIYAYDDQNQNLKLKSENIIYSQEKAHFDIWNINLVADHIISEEAEDAVVGFLQYAQGENQADTVSFTLVPIDIHDQLDTLSIGTIEKQYQNTIPPECFYDRQSTLEAKDINRDGIAEIFSAFSFGEYELPHYQDFKVYQLDGQLNLSQWADLTNLVPNFHADIALGTVVLDTLETTPATELLIPAKLDRGRIWIYKIKTDAGGNFDQVELIHKGPRLEIAKTENIQVADFDGDIRMGAPRKFSITKILQPLVILNAPPIHFDVLNDQQYDVSLSYNNNVGNFVSSYIKESSQFAEVETQVNTDWSISATATAGFSFWGVSVSAYLSETYGERFSKVENSSQTVTVSVAVDAIEDDRIYALVLDYNIYEYPVFVNDILRGNILVVEPLIAEHRWFPSKSWSGYDYIPNHEVGNILSYRQYATLTGNPMLDEKIKGDYNNSFVLDANSSYDWTLLFEDFESSEVSRAKEFSRDWGVSVSGWGSGFSLDGTYDREDMQTQRTEVSNGLELDVHLDGIDMGLGEVGYRVTPYSYWATNGALIIDYAVQPELAIPGGTETWWQVNYGKRPDPAFILPWRYDPEKGFALEDPVKRHQTKDIVFYPTDPREGDVISIEARVHNFSLLETPSPMGVKFYVGDPDSGGILIKSVDNKTEVFTDDKVPARGTMVVTMEWEVPTGIGTFPRIYAVIDEQNGMQEIHENNNKSWNILQKSTATAIVSEQNSNIPNAFSLKQNYPNPFNPITTIEFSLTNAEFVQLEVFNTLGERVDIIESKELSAGRHAYHFDARMLPSGLYFYRIQAGDFHDVKKMMLIK